MATVVTDSKIYLAMLVGRYVDMIEAGPPEPAMAWATKYVPLHMWNDWCDAATKALEARGHKV